MATIDSNPESSSCVTIVTASYNASQTLERAVGSVFEQTFTDWSLFIVDDASTDNSLQVARDLAAQDPRVKVVSLERNSGPSVARNEALNRTSSQWVTILDADDAFDPQRLMILIQAAKTSGADLVFDQIAFIDPFTLKPTRSPAPQLRRESTLDLSAFLRSERPSSAFKYGYLKPLIAMRVLEDFSLRYNPRARLAEDFQLYAECLLNGGKASLVPFPGYLYTEQSSRTSGRKSPFSQTVYDPQARVEIGDLLIEKYGSVGNSRTLGQLRRYRAWQVLAVDFEASLRGAARMRVLQRLGLLLRKPEAISLVVRRSRLYQVFQRLRARVKECF